jgi:hypothetical protein
MGRKEKEVTTVPTLEVPASLQTSLEKCAPREPVPTWYLKVHRSLVTAFHSPFWIKMTAVSWTGNLLQSKQKIQECVLFTNCCRPTPNKIAEWVGTVFPNSLLMAPSHYPGN